jgi:hypothetical protein
VIGDNNSKVKIAIPPTVDVIIVDRGRERLSYQIRNVSKYMHWINKIIVIKISDSAHSDVIHSSKPVITTPVITVYTKLKKLLDIFQHIHEITPDIADHFVFLGDTTIPIKKVIATDFWSISSKYRMFNYLDIHAKTVGFEEYFEDTMPVMIVHLKDLILCETLDYYILSLSVTDTIVYSPFINHKIIFTDNDFADTIQVKKQTNIQQLFMTLLISPTLSNNAQHRMNMNAIELISST